MPSMVATIVPGACALVAVAKVEGITCLVVDCENFDEYRTLPAALTYMGVVCGKTGWNSDKNVAYFQSNRTVAFIV